MTSFFARIGDWFKALFEPAPDPRQSFGYTYKRQYELLQRVQGALANTRLTRKHLETRLKEFETRMATIPEAAQPAGDHPESENASVPERLRGIATNHIDEIKRQIVEASEEEARLEKMEQKLSAQIETLLARQELIQAQQHAAQAQVNLRQELSHVSQEMEDLDNILASAEQRAKQFRQQVREIDRRFELDGEASDDNMEAG